MDNSVRVLGWANGAPNASVMFIGEAPGRLGADRTAIPFHGDRAGDNFERLLRVAGIPRSDAFVTNSILCNPTDLAGNNRPPAAAEIHNCSTLLNEQIRIVDPKIICTLGAAALKALSLIENHDLLLKQHVRTVNEWSGRKLIPLYHPGQRAMVHRNFAKQTSDYYFVAEEIQRYGSQKVRQFRQISTEIESLVAATLEITGEISLFKAHKLLYLAEYEARKQGRSFGLNFIRQKNGPYCLELARKKFTGAVKCQFKDGQPFLFLSEQISLFSDNKLPEIEADHVRRWAELDDARIKSLSYLTAPMRRILRLERSGIRCNNTLLFAQN